MAPQLNYFSELIYEIQYRAFFVVVVDWVNRNVPIQIKKKNLKRCFKYSRQNYTFFTILKSITCQTEY